MLWLLMQVASKTEGLNSSSPERSLSADGMKCRLMVTVTFAVAWLPLNYYFALA